MRDLSKDLFITAAHVARLSNCSESTGRRRLKSIRERFGVYKPHRVTRDHLILFEKISEEQYIAQMKGTPRT